MRYVKGLPSLRYCRLPILGALAALSSCRVGYDEIASIGSGASPSAGGSSGGVAGTGTVSGGTAGQEPGAGGSAVTGGAGSSPGAGGGGAVAGSVGAAAGTVGSGGSGASGGGAGGEGSGGCTPTNGSVEACDGLDNDCNGEIDETSPCASGCFAATYGGHGYMFCGTKLLWDDARAYCEQSSMHLIRIDDGPENAWLAATAYADATIAASFGMFVGGSDQGVEGEWRWLDGEQFWSGTFNGSPVGGLYSNWRSVEPNNQGSNEDCLGLRNDATWSDLRCDGVGGEMAFGCETL